MLGLYLGLSKTKIKEQIEAIAEFTELGAFIDRPLRTYSTGRAFTACLWNRHAVVPEILLLDEGIKAGAAASFRRPIGG